MISGRRSGPLRPGPAHLLLLAVLAGGCGGTVSEPPASGAPAPKVEYAGCRRAFAGPVCVLGADRRLTLWIAAPAGARIVIEADGRPIEGAAAPVQLGLRYRLDLGGAARRLVVRVDGAAPWELALRPADPSPWWDETSSHLRAGDLDAARSVVGKARESGSAAPGRALSALARIALFNGEQELARELLERAIRTHREGGELLQQTRDAAALFDLAYRRHDLVAARRVLAALPRDWGGPAEAAYIAAYYPARLANRTGDLRKALRLLQAAADQAERLGMRDKWLEAAQVLARQLQELGRGAEASALVRGVIDAAPEDQNPCVRGELLNNVAWISLLALEAGEPGEDPGELFERTLEIFTRECTLRRFFPQRANATLNLALAHLHGARLPEARQRLREVAELGPIRELNQMLWLLEIEGRLALEDARPAAALRSYRELAALAEAALSPDAQWRAALGQARALRAAGRRSEALDALAEAERRLDAASLMVPLTEGRETFFKRREEGIRRYLDLLLDSGRRAEALAVTRRARSRVLRGLLREDRLAHLSPGEQERWDRTVSSFRARRARLDAEAAGDWRLSRERRRRIEAARDAAHLELLRDLDDALVMLDGRSPEPERPPPPRAGELLLAYHPLPAGWAGFAQDAHGLAVRRLGCEVEDLSPRRLGECLLGPFADRIARARRIRVLPYGALRQVDFHALPYGDDVLLAAAPVVYGLDLDRRPEEPSSGPPRALVVADPAGELPAARREAEAVVEALSAAGREGPGGEWRVRSLWGKEATGGSVRDLLPRVDLLHYAGHGTFAGLGGWESALPLADGSRLTVGDVLTLESAPRWVVLSGCETGRTSRRAAAESVSLAHAFLIAGAGSVVAATRPVADVAAFRLVTTFYRLWSGGAPADLALRDAQLELRRHDPGADWAAFRFIEL